MNKGEFMAKHEWKKDEKTIYNPKEKAEKILIPKFKYFTIEGKGDPNNDEFPQYVETLYTLSYAVRMSYKQDYAPKDYFEYTVYPLEGTWDISDDAKIRGTFEKKDFTFKLMIRQPDFVDASFAELIIATTLAKNKNPLITAVKFETIEEGLCVQILHIGSYDEEFKSFALIDDFCKNNGMKRVSKAHKEIYLSDARKIESSKLKTILRVQVEEL